MRFREGLGLNTIAVTRLADGLREGSVHGD
jgi:hypothetical protein